MEKKAKKKKSAMDLQHFIIDIVYRNSCQTIQLPSVRQLASDFSLAKSTVQLVIEKLTNEGFLFSKVGIGTFTNPSMGFSLPSTGIPPLIGIIWGNGKIFFQDHYICKQLSTLGLAITEAGYNIRHLKISSTSNEDTIDEILNGKLDALVWASFDEEPYGDVLRGIKSELPTVILNTSALPEGVSVVRFDFKTQAEEVVDFLIEEDRKRALFAVLGECPRSNIRNLDRAYQKSLIDYESVFLENDPSTLLAGVEEALQNFCPDVLFVNTLHLDALTNLMEKYNIDPVQECRIVVLGNPASYKGKGILTLNEVDHEAGATNILEILQDIIEKKNYKIQQRFLPVKARNMTPIPKKSVKDSKKVPEVSFT